MDKATFDITRLTSAASSSVQPSLHLLEVHCLCALLLSHQIDDFNFFISVLFAQCCISENFGELLLCFVHSSLCYDFSHNSWFEVFVLEHIWNIFFLIHYIKFCFQTYLPYIKSYAMANNSIPTPTNP